MQKNNHSPQIISDTTEHPINFEISILDVIKFFQESWKRLAIAAFFGAFFGFAGWSLFGSYSASYTLINNYNNNSYALDIVSWKMLQKSLPNLAAQIISENKVPENQLALYGVMSGEHWWQKNAIPSYSLTKSDTKDLVGIDKGLDSASTAILSLNLIAAGSSREQATINVRLASQFLRTGGAYLQARSLLNSYEAQTLSLRAELIQKITNTQIEMGYQLERAKELELLRNRYPNNQSASVSQTVNSSDASAKYLPLTVQIIATNTDINASKELISRLERRLEQINLSKIFLDKALPLQEQTYDGLTLVTQLLEIERELREKTANTNHNAKNFFEILESQLLAIQVRFTKGLEANTAPTASGKTGVVISALGGLIAAFLLLLLILLGLKVLRLARGDS